MWHENSTKQFDKFLDKSYYINYQDTSETECGHSQYQKYHRIIFAPSDTKYIEFKDNESNEYLAKVLKSNYNFTQTGESDPTWWR